MPAPSQAAGAIVDPAMREGPSARRLRPHPGRPGAEENLVLDLTQNDRFGLRGPGVTDWLAEAGLTLPERVNEALVLPCGTAILRLGQQEVLLTAAPGGGGERLRELHAAWRASRLEPKGFDAFREEGWAWIVVSGPAAARLMPRISMTDLGPRALKPGQIVQTRALHMDAVVTRLDRFGVVSYDLFFDIASASFALDVLADTAKGVAADFKLATLAAAA